MKELDYDLIEKGIETYLPPRFMTVNTALCQLREIEERRGEGGELPCDAVRQARDISEIVLYM